MDFVYLRHACCPATHLTLSLPVSSLSQEAERLRGQQFREEAGLVLLLAWRLSDLRTGFLIP